MKLDNIIVNSLYIIKSKTCPKVFNVAPRNHHSLSYRLRGENIIYNKGVKTFSNADTITFVPKGIAYTHRIVSDSEQIIIHFTTKDCIGNSITIFRPPLYDIKELFTFLYNQWELKQKENDLQCMSIFYNILSLIETKTSLSKSCKKNKFLKESIEYIHANYRKSDFNISSIYEQIYISSAYYRRTFKKVYHCSPIEYLKKLRINYAKQLLHSGYYSIAQISELSGFSAPTYFSYEFKKATGYPPTKYNKL
ncbi:MAG: AraC family transcriptional regulator [Firmicutes bacterium]|nr:AraC family transcriptional regulator [Bacillota bacterium]